MKLIYTHENKILVENARNYLTEHGIKSVLRNEFAAGGLGDIAPIQAWPELWVLQDEDIPKALELIKVLSKDSEKSVWNCESCGEINEGNFELCWQCQTEKE